MSRCEDIEKNKEGKLLTNKTTVIVDITIRMTTLVRAAEHALPMTIIAAKETVPQRQIPWPQQGRQLSSHTGFQPRLRACDKTLSFTVAPG
jgi:hypothetical protein